MNEIAVQWFGMLAVALMVACYALDHRSRIYAAWFAFACVLSAIYAQMIGSYLFVIAEAIWAIIAIRRYRSLTSKADTC